MSERLEEIKSNWYDNDTIEINEVPWLIQQAEKAEELEKVEYALQEIYRQERQYSERLEKENQRLKQVLEFYANEKNYERAYDDEVLFDYLPSEIDFDNDEKARKALESESK